MRLKHFYLTLLIVTVNIVFAQNEVDALRYSQPTFGGTARSIGMAGSFGALGADFSTLSTNPAGIGLYRRSELVVTPSLFSQHTTSTYNNVTTDNSKSNFNFSNAGIVGVFKNHSFQEGTEGWVSGSIGFGYNRYNNFHNRLSIEGANSNSSLLDFYLNQASGTTSENLSAFSTGLAFDTYLLDTNYGENTSYYSPIPFAGEYQKKSIETSGSMGETVFSFGGNYSNKLYVGGTIGIPHIRYTEDALHSESDHMDTIPGFKNFTLNQYVSTRGSGLNAKLGFIYRVTDWVRFGIAYHTPSTYSMHDKYKYTMNSEFDNGNKYTSDSPDGSFDYKIITPSRTMASIAFIIGQRAALNVDYEFVDYTAARLRSNPDDFTDANMQIRKKYTGVSNLRLGGEMRFDPFVVRLGYANYGSPYKPGININGARNSFTMGLGFREKNYYLDLAYVVTTYNEDYYLYDPTSVQLNAAQNCFKQKNFVATFGVKF